MDRSKIVKISSSISYDCYDICYKHKIVLLYREKIIEGKLFIYSHDNIIMYHYTITSEPQYCNRHYLYIMNDSDVYIVLCTMANTIDGNSEI